MPPGLTPPGSCLAALAAEFEAPVSPKIGWKSSVFNVERSNLITGDSFRAFSVNDSVLSPRRMCPKHSSCASSAKLISQPERKPDKDIKDYDNSATVRTPSALLDLFFASAQLLCHLRYTIHLRTMKISPCCVKFQGTRVAETTCICLETSVGQLKNHSVRPPHLT